MTETVLIVGAAGQDGTYLSRLHRRRGDRVIGLTRLGLFEGAAFLQPGVDLTDAASVAGIVDLHKPDRIYYLAAYHHSSETRPDGQEAEDLQRLFRNSVDINLAGWLNVLAAADRCRYRPRLFYASSSLVFGQADGRSVDEITSLAPVNAYGITKVAAMQAGDYYRKARDLHVSTGILFNHESIRRPPSFVTRKISIAAANAARGADDPLSLRNPHATVDWTAAEDVVAAMALIADQKTPDTYVIGSGVTRSILEFAEAAYGVVDLPVPTIQCPEGVQPAPGLAAPALKLRSLGWEPRYPWPLWVRRMVRSEYRLQRSPSVT